MTDDAIVQAVPPRANLAAVAALAGVSRSTASLAFSGTGPVSQQTRAKVFAAAEKLGYGGPDPRARSLRRGRSGIVGVVIEDRLRDAFRDPMNIAMLDGLADETGGLGSGLLLLTDTGEGGSTIERAPMDAVVLVGCSTGLHHSVAILRQRGIPIVAIEAEPMEGVFDVALDNREASAAGARYLQELGHETVAVVTLPLAESHARGELPPDWELVATSYTAVERLRGVRDVFPHFTGRTAAASTIDEGERAGLAILGADDPPTAIIAQSDLLALGVMRAATEWGLSVPGDVSILGFDGIRTDSILSSESVELATLVQPAVEKGRAAGRAIVGLLAGRHPKPVLLHSVLRHGGTVAEVSARR